MTDQHLDNLTAARKRVTDAKTELAAASQAFEQAILDAHAAGVRGSDIARQCQISRQRISQLTKHVNITRTKIKPGTIKVARVEQDGQHVTEIQRAS